MRDSLGKVGRFQNWKDRNFRIRKFQFGGGYSRAFFFGAREDEDVWKVGGGGVYTDGAAEPCWGRGERRFRRKTAPFPSFPPVSRACNKEKLKRDGALWGGRGVNGGPHPSTGLPLRPHLSVRVTTAVRAAASLAGGAPAASPNCGASRARSRGGGEDLVWGEGGSRAAHASPPCVRGGFGRAMTTTWLCAAARAPPASPTPRRRPAAAPTFFHPPSAPLASSKWGPSRGGFRCCGGAQAALRPPRCAPLRIQSRPPLRSPPLSRTPTWPLGLSPLFAQTG